MCELTEERKKELQSYDTNMAKIIRTDKDYIHWQRVFPNTELVRSTIYHLIEKQKFRQIVELSTVDFPKDISCIHGNQVEIDFGEFMCEHINICQLYNKKTKESQGWKNKNL